AFQRGYTDTGYIQLSQSSYGRLTYSGDRTGASVVYTYTSADGTEIVFRALGGGDCSDSRRCAYASEMTEADGTRYSFDYAASGENSGGAARLRRVTSSRGFALLLEGSGHLV